MTGGENLVATLVIDFYENESTVGIRTGSDRRDDGVVVVVVDDEPRAHTRRRTRV